jgi:hypothetical protein
MNMEKPAPDWLVAEMPPGYHNRLFELRRLSEEVRAMERFGHLLWQVGPDLTEAVLDGFAALGFETGRVTGPTFGYVTVKLDPRRRLLLFISATTDVIQKKGTEVAHVFEMLHEHAEETDRVVLVTNADPVARPSERSATVGPEALNLLQRLGANVLPGPTLFALWMLSFEDRERAHKLVERLHEQDGGVFEVPTIAAR